MAKPAGRKAAPVKKTAADERKYLCFYCNTEKNKTDFYMSTDPRVLAGITNMCKECVQKIALNYDERTQTYGSCTKKSVQDALEYIDRPFLETVWESSYAEWADDTRTTTNIWAAYIRIISMPQYRGMRWRDSDIFQTYVEDAKQAAMFELAKEGKITGLTEEQEINNEYSKNRRDVIRLLGYDPFEGERIEDQPLLYSQLLGYLDASGDNDDMLRTSSAITIVRGFLQQTRIDDRLARAMLNSNVNTTEIKQLLDSKKNIASTIALLAEQNCLSLKHSKNASKGENTWTGIIKKMQEINLREAEVNAFDIGTAEGMRQVAEISNASIIKQIRLDENDYNEMLIQQREMITRLQKTADENEETARILLRENIDLKKYIEEQGLDISEFCE